MKDTGAGKLAVCGASGHLGRLVVRRLHRTRAVTAFDPRPCRWFPVDVAHRAVDVASNRARTWFRKERFDAVIQVGAAATPGRSGGQRFTRAIENFSRLLQYCDRYGVGKIVVVSSGTLYGARPENSQFLTEDAPLLAPDLSALRDIDMLAQTFFWKRPDIETVILRPAHVVGPVDNLVCRYLRLEDPPVVWGYNPMMQVVHAEDVVSAVELALRPGVRGIFNLAGPPPLRLRSLLHRLGRTPVPIPHPFTRWALRRLRRRRAFESTPLSIDYIRFVCMVDDTRARKELAYAPAYDLDACVRDIATFTPIRSAR